MKLQGYLSSLLPSFSKTRMKEDLAVMREELKHTTLPPYKSVAMNFGKRKFNSEAVEEFDKLFKQRVDTEFRGNFLAVVEQTLQRVAEKMDTLDAMIESYYADDVMRDAMTFLKVNILQYMETMAFAMRYSRRLLVWTIDEELRAVEPDASADTLSPAEVEWLHVNRQNFFMSITILGGKKAEMEKSFKDIPDIVATKDNIPTIEKTVGLAKTDPFNFGLIPTWLNPVYHIRMKIAEWQVKRYKAAEEERKMLEFKLMQLKQSESGKKDAKLQQQIEYTQNRLQKLNFELKDMEDAHA